MRWLCFALLLSGVACFGHPGEQWREGGLYACRQEDGAYAVAKILKLDAGGVHVRVYSNRYETFPKTLDESALYLAGVDRAPGEQLGMGHLPLSRASFAAWEPKFIKIVPVNDSELEGYRMWYDAGAGYF